MRRILVTAISGNVSNGILKILSETKDRVFGCDIYDYPIGMDKVEAYWKSDAAVENCYIDNLLQKCKEFRITHLIPVNEQEIEVINKNIHSFLNADIKVIINSPKIIDTFLDKYKTYQCLKNMKGIYVPRTFMPCDFIEDGKQYIVKLKKSCGSKFLQTISSEKQLKEIGLKEGEYIVQEYLNADDEEYTVGVFSDGSRVSTIIFKRRLEHGYTVFVELVHDSSIIKMAESIAENIELRGFVNLQLRKINGENYVFEINPRISGTVYFRHMLGFKDVLWWIMLVDGKQVEDFDCIYKEAIGLRELSEKFVIKK